MDQSNYSGDASVQPLTLGERLWLLPIMTKLSEFIQMSASPRVLVALMVSTAFAVAFGIFRENKHRSWSRAVNLAVMRYLFD